MILKKVNIKYLSDNLEETKKIILNILNDYGIFQLELIEDYSLNDLDYNENFSMRSKIWQIEFYLPENRFFDKKILMIKDRIEENNLIYEINYSNLDTDTYKDEWKKFFITTKLTDKITVNPSWCEYTKQSEDEIVIKIDPLMAFGTGTHETTSLCIDLLETLELKNKTMLDIGFGSGILMIVASKLGCTSVSGIDIDKMCESVAINNFKLNEVENYEVKIGNLLDKVDSKYDIIVSNILVDVLYILLDDITKVLNKGTTLIFSGILTEKKDGFIKKAESIGLKLISSKNKNKWTGIVMRYE